jgi:hypothetical protein
MSHPIRRASIAAYSLSDPENLITPLAVMPMSFEARKSRTLLATDLLAIPDAAWNFLNVVSGSMAASVLKSSSGCKSLLYWFADI